MAQLRDSIIDGNLEVTNDIILKQTENSALKGVHSNGEIVSMIDFNETNLLRVGHGNYTSGVGMTSIYGTDVNIWCGQVHEGVRPYYRAGDTIDIVVKTCGFVTASGTAVAFTIPLTKPVIGNPTAEVTSNTTFVLRQNGNYTHGSDGAASPVVNAIPKSYSIESNYNSGIVVTAVFDSSSGAGSVENNSHIGVTWSGKIKLT